MGELACARGASPRMTGCMLALLVAVPLAAVLGCEPADPLPEIRALQDAGRYQDSIEPLRVLIDEGTDDPEVLFLYGRALGGAGYPTQALWPLTRLMQNPDWTDRAAIQLARLAISTTDWDMAVEMVTPVIEREPDHVQALVLRGYARAQSRQDYEGTLEDVDRALALEPDNSDALVLRGVALLGLERVEEAGEAIEAASKHFDEAGLGLARSSRFCVVRATFAKEKGEPEKAEEIFETCLEQHPTDYLVVDEGVKFFDALSRTDRSLEIVRAAFEGLPDDRGYRLALVQRLSAAGEEGEAEALMRAATDVEPPHAAAAAFADLAGYYFQRDRLDDAVGAFDEALSRVDEPNPELLFTYSDTLVAAERHDEALAIAERMTVEPHRELVIARVALARGNPAKALRHFEKGFELWPNNAVARYFAAEAAEELGDIERAIEEYRYSIRADAGATDSRFRLARLYAATGQHVSALEVVRHEADTKPSGKLQYLLLELELMARIGSASQLPKRLHDAIEPAPIWPHALAALARGSRAAEGPAAALEVVERADRLDLSDPANVAALVSLVDDLIALDRADEALARVEEALRGHPDFAPFHTLAGDARAALGRTDEAFAAWERAIGLDPEDARALRSLAGARAAAGDFEAALDLYGRAARADPGDTEALHARAELLVELGRAPAARRDWAAVLARDPYDGPASLRLADLLEASDVDGTGERVRVLRRRGALFRAPSAPDAPQTARADGTPG